MPIIDILLLLISGFTGLFASLILLKQTLRSPIPLVYCILCFSILSLGLNFLLVLPIVLFDSSTILSVTFTHLELVYLLRLSHFFAISFVLSFTLITYLPSFTVDLKSILLLIFTTLFNTAAAVIDLFTLDFVIKTDKIKISYNIFGFISVVISLVLLIYIMILRYNEIGELLKNQPTSDSAFKNPFQSRNKFYGLILLIISSFILGRVLNFLPGYLWAGFTEIGLLYLIYSLKKNSAFFFVSNSKLEGIIILNSKSGKIQYYKNYKNVDMLITSVVTAFNISIKHMIASTTDIEQIIFEDVSLLLSKGKFTTTIVLVTKKTIISDLITKYIAKKFEKTYNTVLEKAPYGVDDMTPFQTFNNEITKITNYFST